MAYAPNGVVTSFYYPVDFKSWKVFDGLNPDSHDLKTKVELVHVFGEGEVLSAYFVTSDDSVYGIGRTDFGRLGIGDCDHLDLLEPQKILELCGVGVVCFASGAQHSLALTQSGEVFSWGLNMFGNLGNGTIISRNSPGKLFLPENTKIKAIGARSSYSVAVTTENVVLHWGDVRFTECTNQNLPIELEFDSPISVRQLACSFHHVCLLTNDDRVYVWGTTSVEKEITHTTPCLLTSKEHKNIVSIACSIDVTVALNEEGQIYVLQGPSCPNSLDIVLKEQKTVPVVEIAGAPYSDSPLVFRLGSGRFIHVFFPYQERDSMSSYETEEERSRCIQSAFAGMATPQVFRRSPGEDDARVQRLQGPVRNIGNALFNVKEYSDLEVTLRDGEVYVHKLILIAFCEHFKSMLVGSWANQNESSKLDMRRYNPRAYRAFLKYIYTGGLDLMQPEDLIDLYDISKSYLEDELMNMCSQMFQKILKPNSVAILYRKAHDLNFEELMGHLVEFAGCCLEQVVLSEGFENLEPALAKRLVISAFKSSKSQSLS